MLDPTTFSHFLTATIILSITPGPGIIYTVARTLHGGKSQGILSALGLFVGGLFHVLAAAIGISSLLMNSAIAFTIIKYVGAAYLIYLGCQTILHQDSVSIDPDAAGETKSRGNAFYQGVITEALNPKTALFFLAFIPQFINVAQGNILMQFLVLGVITDLFNLAADLVFVLLAEPIGKKLRHSPRARRGQQITSGLTLIGLGTYVAIADHK